MSEERRMMREWDPFVACFDTQGALGVRAPRSLSRTRLSKPTSLPSPSLTFCPRCTHRGTRPSLKATETWQIQPDCGQAIHNNQASMTLSCIQSFIHLLLFATCSFAMVKAASLVACSKQMTSRNSIITWRYLQYTRNQGQKK